MYSIPRQSSDMQIVKIAHELGHFCIPSHDSYEFRCTEAEIASYRAVSLFEREANKFAGELLLPLSEVERVLKGPPSMRLVSDIAESYGTSMTATAVRVVQATCEPVAPFCRAVVESSGPSVPVASR